MFFLLFALWGAGAPPAFAIGEKPGENLAKSSEASLDESLKGSFIEAVEMGNPTLLEMRINHRLDGSASEFIRALYHEEEINGLSASIMTKAAASKSSKLGYKDVKGNIFHHLALASDRQEEFAKIMQDLIQIADFSRDSAGGRFIALAEGEEYQPPNFLGSASDWPKHPFINTSFWENGFSQSDPLAERKAILRELYEKASARDFFRYLHWTESAEGKPLFALLAKDYLEAIGDRRPLFVTTELSLLKLAKESGNLPAYKALRGTAFYSDESISSNLGLGSFCAGAFCFMGWFIADMMYDWGVVKAALGPIVKALPMPFDEIIVFFALPAVVVASGVASAFASIACYEIFQEAQIKRNALRSRVSAGGLAAFE